MIVVITKISYSDMCRIIHYQLAIHSLSPGVTSLLLSFSALYASTDNNHSESEFHN